jgi:hypothetical protein
MVSIRFQCSDDRLPEHHEGPFNYIQMRYDTIEAEWPDGKFVAELAGLNEDGTWNAGPNQLRQNGYTDIVVYRDPPTVPSPKGP